MMPRFRAWDKEEGEMLSDISLENDTWDMMNEFFRNTDELVFMQYTGLKDKNGVEIYEGYIIMDEDFRKYAVVFADGMFGCMKSHLADYVTKRRYEVIDPLYNMTLNSVCIIGNIYENPELLEVNQ